MIHCILLTILLTIPVWSVQEENGKHIQPRIAGGRPAKLKEFPFVVALLYNGKIRCTGSIVNRRYVITAAHCRSLTIARKWVVKAGLVDINDPTPFTHGVKRFNRHPTYRKKGDEGPDIAYIEVDPPFIFNDRVQPIKPNKKRGDVKGGLAGQVIGWGNIRNDTASTALNVLDVTTQNKVSCDYIWAGLKKKYTWQTCAKPASTTQGTCYKDSGAPLVINNTLVAVLSQGSLTCNGLVPSQYVKVSSFKTWIRKSTALNKQTT